MPYADSRRVRIHYQVVGAGPPLVMQHGFTDSLETWHELGYVEALQKSFRLILVDARGHGASDKPHDPRAHVHELLVADVLAVLDDLSVVKAHFFGYSMGGRIGFAIAKYAPDRFCSLIIGGASPYPGSREGFEARVAMLKRGSESIPAIWDAPVSLAHRARLLTNDTEAMVASWIGRMDRPALQDVPATMTVPCLVFVGERDAACPGVTECVKQMPNATFVCLPGLNHAEAFFRADLVLPHVTRFLASVPC